MSAQAASAYVRNPADKQRSLLKAEVVVTSLIAVTTVIKIATFGNIVSVVGDVVFVLGICAVRSKTALVMLLLAAAIAIPSVPGVDKAIGLVFYLEILGLVLAVRLWLSSGMSLKLTIGKPGLTTIIAYNCILLLSIVRAGSFSDHLVTARYMLIMVFTAETVRHWVLQDRVTLSDIEEIVFRALRAGLVVYIVIFALQFVFPSAYDQVFVASNGEREGTRVAYQIQGYIPVLALALLAIGTSPEKYNNLQEFYRNVRWGLWLILSLFAMLATGARMALVQWVLIALVFIFFKSIRSVGLVVIAGGVAVFMLNLPIFASVAERITAVANPDSFAGNLGIRLLPALLAANDMHGVDFLVGKGLNYKFFVPWFEVRGDDFEAYSTFIDQLWATVFVQAGFAGCLLILAVFIAGVRFIRKHRVVLKSLPSVRFLILFYLAYVHGFSNLAYAKDVYVYLGFVIGCIALFKAPSVMNSQSVIKF